MTTLQSQFTVSNKVGLIISQYRRQSEILDNLYKNIPLQNKKTRLFSQWW